MSRRQFAIGGAALLTSAAGLALVPRHGHRTIAHDALLDAFPIRFGEWAPVPMSEFVLPLEDEGEEGVYSNLLTRAYANAAGAIVMLVIAYAAGETGTIVVHRPEACYPANGFALAGRREVEFADPALGIALTGVFYTANAYDRTEQLLYWTRIGPYFPTDWLTEQVALVRSNLVGQLPDGALVRMSTVSNDPDGARGLLRDFAGRLSEHATPLGREILFGGA